MPVRNERSAGVIVFRIEPGSGEAQFLLLDYGRHWDYPKGHLEAGEDEIAAATRELREETGIDDLRFCEGFRHALEYTFRDRRKGLIRKTVTLFLGQTRIERATISHEHVGWAFLPYVEAHERLTYANAREGLEAAQAFLDRPPPVGPPVE